MLDFAINHVEELQYRYRQAIQSEKNMYYFTCPIIQFDLNIDTDNANILQFVSVADGVVHGYFDCNINRLTNKVHNLSIIRFGDTDIFRPDLFHLFYKLFMEYNFNYIAWNVVVGNPAEALYDYIVDKYGGRIVGTFEQDVMLPNGKLYDLKFYEFSRNSFVKGLEKGVNAFNYRK